MDSPRSTEEALRVVENFNGLPLEKRLEIFNSLSPPAREALIQVVSRPGEILRRLSVEEVYYTVKAAGEDNASHLIAGTTGKQLQYILDLELWKKEMFDTHAAARWLELISRTSEEKILQFVQVSDIELVVTCLHPFVRVVIRNPEIDLTEQKDILPSFTLDDVFFVEFRTRGSEDVIRNFIETIFGWSTQYYFGLMEELSRGIHSENEELAAKWRRARLSEHGFPDLDDSLRVYQYLHRNSIAEYEISDSFPLSEELDQSATLLDYPLKVINADNLFKRCIDRMIDAREVDRLVTELAHLGNKVMVADAGDPGSIDDLHSSLRKVSGHINLALEEMVGDDVSKGVAVLRANHLEFLFRRGFSLILDLRKEAQTLLRNYEGGTENLGYPLAGLINGLLQKRPFYAGIAPGDSEPRQFESLQDIERIRSLMNRQTIEDRWEQI